MQYSRKSFKSLSLAQPIKKDIDQSLSKLEQQKRKYLSLQRQEFSLKDQLQKVRRQLNEVKLIQPKTRVKQNKNNQTSLSITNTERIYLNTVNNISQLKVTIEVHRRQVGKYKKLTNEIINQINKIQRQNNQIETDLLRKQQKNQQIKDHLLEFRQINMRNTDEFKQSFQALSHSSIKEQNQRKKSQIKRKSNQGQDLKFSKYVNLAEIQEQNNAKFGENMLKNDNYMTNSIPLVKERVRLLIHNNKEKLKISQNYKKFGQDLQNMFSIMMQYKGRDDISFIADQFVMKQNQLKKIEQYIGKLQNRLMSYEKQIQKIKSSDKQLKEQLSRQQNEEHKLQEQQYVKMQEEMKHIITNLKVKEQENSEWFKQISQILAPLVNGQQLNRSNFDMIFGQIQEKYLKEQKEVQKYQQRNLNKSPTKGSSIPNVDEKEIKSSQYAQLMSYNKLKQYAKQYISKK